MEIKIEDFSYRLLRKKKEIQGRGLLNVLLFLIYLTNFRKFYIIFLIPRKFHAISTLFPPILKNRRERWISVKKEKTPLFPAIRVFFSEVRRKTRESQTKPPRKFSGPALYV